ncbi:MAG TPA: rod shape-determining protein MreD [Planctomycetota bacterium]|nr:rod shape-determining protein MreD [Planctomycetota bacterium]
MKNYSVVRLLAVAAAALVVELTLMSGLAWAGARPDLLVPIVAFAALFATEPSRALGTAWAVGLMRDLGTAGPLGQYALIYLVLAWSITALRPLLFREHPLTQVAVGGIAAAFAGLAAAACTAAFTGGIPLTLVLARTLSSAAITALVAPLAVTVLSRNRFLVH